MIIQLFTETKVLEALEHPFIVAIKDTYKTMSNKLVMILEYAQNGDMKHKIDQQDGRPFSEDLLRRELTRLDRAALPGVEILSR